METLIILLRWEGKYTLQWIIICHIFSQVATLSDIDLHFYTRPIPVIYLFVYFFFNLPPPPPPHKKGQNHGVFSCWKPHAIFLFLWNRIKFFKRESKPLTRSLKIVTCCCSFTILLSHSCKLNFQSHWPLAKRILLFCIFDLFSGLTQ